MESILDILPGRKLFNRTVTCILDEKIYIEREDHFLVNFLGYSRFHVYTRTFQIEDRFIMEIDLIDLERDLVLRRIFLQITNIENLDVNVITTCQNFKMEFFSSGFMEAEDKFEDSTLPSNSIAMSGDIMSPDDNVPLDISLIGLYNMIESRLNEIPGPKLYFVKDICISTRSIVNDTSFWISIFIIVLIFFFIMYNFFIMYSDLNLYTTFFKYITSSPI